MRWIVRLVVPCLLAAAALAGCASTPPAVGTLGDGPRSIVIIHHPSGETVSATYWRGNGYDPDALRDISVLFRDRRTGEVVPVDPALVDMLVELRERCGASAETPIRLTSGYRSVATNAFLARTNPNVADNSYHMRGQAADFSIPGVPPGCLGEAAAAMRRGGYAVYQHTGHVHVDTGPFRTWIPKGSEPRSQPVTVEAKAAPREKAATRVEVAAAPQPSTPPMPMPVSAPGPRPAPGTVSRSAIAKAPAPPELVRVRTVLAQLKDQPPAATRDRRKAQP